MNQPSSPQPHRRQSPSREPDAREMATQPAASMSPEAGSTDSGRPEPRFSLPAWLVSVVLHAVILIAAGFTINMGPVGIKADATTTIGGEIVLKQMTDEGEKYYTEESASAMDQLAHAPSPDPLSEAPSVTPNKSPLDLDLLGPSSANTGLSGGGLGDIIGNPGQPKAAGHTSRTTFMSMSAEGSSFVFLIDRSASMGDGRVGSRLNFAASQAQAALSHLDENARFQILFYNHEILPFRLSGKPEQMFFATEQNKTLASRFLSSTSATGNTESAKALLKAIGYGPDVIFFLSDSQSNLNYIDLEQIRNKNNGGQSVSINVIEFAPSPGDPTKNNLRKLAEQNRGNYVFVSTDRMDAGK